jgi:hypothetical protein
MELLFPRGVTSLLVDTLDHMTSELVRGEPGWLGRVDAKFKHHQKEMPWWVCVPYRSICE